MGFLTDLLHDSEGTDITITLRYDCYVLVSFHVLCFSEDSGNSLKMCTFGSATLVVLQWNFLSQFLKLPWNYNRIVNWEQVLFCFVLKKHNISINKTCILTEANLKHIKICVSAFSVINQNL